MAVAHLCAQGVDIAPTSCKHRLQCLTMKTDYLTNLF
jgi:hypothetical protein